MKQKIFLIGFSKTGTVSYHQAFLRLGFRSIHHFDESGNKATLKIQQALQEGLPMMHYIDNYDVYSDLVLWKHFRMLHEQYPDSYYILNTRDPERRSVSKTVHNKRHNAKSQEEPDRDVSDEARLQQKEFQQRKEKDIEQYFEGNPNFLKIDIEEEDKWMKICELLKIEEIPDEPFPRANQKQSLFQFWKMNLSRKFKKLIS